MRRVMRENGLLAPHRVGRTETKPHDGTIITDKANEMWGTDMTQTITERGRPKGQPLIVDDLRAARMNTAADLVERSISETLTYYAFPDIHWQKIGTIIRSSGS